MFSMTQQYTNELGREAKEESQQDPCMQLRYLDVFHAVYEERYISLPESSVI